MHCRRGMRSKSNTVWPRGMCILTMVGPSICECWLSGRQIPVSLRRELSWSIRCVSITLPQQTCRWEFVQFSDVNAFLTFAATRHILQPEELKENPRIDRIVVAAKTGRIPVHLVSSERYSVASAYCIWPFQRSLGEESSWKCSSRCRCLISARCFLARYTQR